MERDMGGISLLHEPGEGVGDESIAHGLVFYGFKRETDGNRLVFALVECRGGGNIAAGIAQGGESLLGNGYDTIRILHAVDFRAWGALVLEWFFD